MPTLQDLRKQAKLTQASLAQKSGLRQATISALEGGRSVARAGTVQALAEALGTHPDTVLAALRQTLVSLNKAASDLPSQLGDWPFLDGLDRDLRAGLAQSLVAEWTHSSAALEGNTISAGDTLFVLSQGLTVSGKSLREHQELHGHAQAVGLMAGWTRARQALRVELLHELHRAIQTGAVIDVLAPVGKWKVEPNGTNAITTSGKTSWHDYASPRDVPSLMEEWLSLMAKSCRRPRGVQRDPGSTSDLKNNALDVYTDVYLGFVGIHPYADGNGRMARLLANIPVLRTGLPPLLVSASERRTYLTLIGDYSLRRGPVCAGEALVLEGPERTRLREFFGDQWQSTVHLVAEFHQRQRARKD